MSYEAVGDLRDIPDLIERARGAQDFIEAKRSDIEEASRIRREAVADLAATKTHAEIAEALGITRARVGQILKEGPPPERLFWGTGELTIAVGRKLEGPKDAAGKPGGVVAEEDLQAFCALTASVAPMGLTTHYEVIPPPGFVRLNRENLVVICGPRLSPMVGQTLESDPVLAFAKDEAGWHLIDRKTRETYRSPLDNDGPQDYGYLGRLPRPDSRGTFLYIAGIHAVGAPGVIHYLERNLAEVYREVKTKRFSTLIRCEFDPETHEITSSERVTPFYRHEGN
jgi:hypothetical protein